MQVTDTSAQAATTPALQGLVDAHAALLEARRARWIAQVEADIRTNRRALREAARQPLAPGEIRRFAHGRLTGSVMTVGTGQTQYLIRMDGEVLNAFSGTCDREGDALRSFASALDTVVCA